MTDAPQPLSDGQRYAVSAPLQVRNIVRTSLLLLLLPLLLVACGGQSGSASLTIGVSGLPQGAKADISLADGSGSTTQLDGEETFRGLAPGSYRVSAKDVTIAGLQYRPDPASTVVELGGGAVFDVTISYRSSEGDDPEPAAGDSGAQRGSTPEGAANVSGSGVLRGESLQGVLWDDRNGDGAFGKGDVVLPRAEVVLGLAGGKELLTSTDGAGQYRFDGLPAGSEFTLRHGPTARSSEGYGSKSATGGDEKNVRHYIWH